MFCRLSNGPREIGCGEEGGILNVRLVSYSSDGCAHPDLVATSSAYI